MEGKKEKSNKVEKNEMVNMEIQEQGGRQSQRQDEEKNNTTRRTKESQTEDKKNMHESES